MISHLSSSEVTFIKDGIHQNIRIDGRSRLDYRPFTLETGIITAANGSASVNLGQTKVIAAVKLEIGQPMASNPTRGLLKVAVECLPSASPDFEGSGAQDLNIKLSSIMQQLLTASGRLNLEDLCLIPNQKCWVLYIDIALLHGNGNIVDAISIATRAALYNTRIPKVNVIEGGKSGEYELELCEEPGSDLLIPTEFIPIFVSLSQDNLHFFVMELLFIYSPVMSPSGSKIGSHFIVDPSLDEELCLGCVTSIGINKSGHICSIEKGYGMLDIQTLSEITKEAQRIGIGILNAMDKLLENEKTQRLSSR